MGGCNREPKEPYFPIQCYCTKGVLTLTSLLGVQGGLCVLGSELVHGSVVKLLGGFQKWRTICDDCSPQVQVVDKKANQGLVKLPFDPTLFSECKM